MIKIRKQERGCWDVTLPAQGYACVVVSMETFDDALEMARIRIREAAK